MLSDRSREYWDFFISECVRQRAPLYVRLAEGVRDDEALSALAANVRASQPMANLLFGAVHYLLLRGAVHPLSAHYRTLTEESTLRSGDPFPLFRQFCFAHEAEIAALLATRVTNTNEVARSAYLRAGFLTIAAQEKEPLHLIELGPSAGLNLHWHRYNYRYVTETAVHEAGADDERFLITTQIVGGRVPPLGPQPRLGLSLGLERDPVDLNDRNARDWLKALVWPDHRDRFRRLEDALSAVGGLAVDIRAGDALGLLPEALAECPAGGTICVFHTMTTYQFSKTEREALENLLTRASVRRPLWRLSMELSDGVYPLKLDRCADGAKQTRVLGFCDPQGGCPEWRR